MIFFQTISIFDNIFIFLLFIKCGTNIKKIRFDININDGHNIMITQF